MCWSSSTCHRAVCGAYIMKRNSLHKRVMIWFLISMGIFGFGYWKENTCVGKLVKQWKEVQH